MVRLKQKWLHTLLAVSLILAPMGVAVATTGMDHSLMSSTDMHNTNHGTDLQNENQHCKGDDNHLSDDACQHNCCGHSISTAGFVLSCNNSASLFADHTPPFVKALQVLLTTFPHYRPPA